MRATAANDSLSSSPATMREKSSPYPGVDLRASSQPVLHTAEDALHSWKEIAAYLHRDVRTVQRWEKHEGLPVHRHDHRKAATIFAFKREVDDWQRGRISCMEVDAPRQLTSSKVLVSRGPVNRDEAILCQLIEAALAQLLTQAVMSAVMTHVPQAASGEGIRSIHRTKNLDESRKKSDGQSPQSCSCLSRLQ